MEDDDGVALEWCSILEQGWTKDAGEAPGADSVEAEDEDAGYEDDHTMEVATGDDASSLLKIVKERFASVGQSSKYQDFLKAISSSTVNAEAALDVLAGHDDLIASFEQCFAAPIPPSVSTSMRLEDSRDQEEAPDRRGPVARVSQLVNLVFANKARRPAERARMLEYVRARMKVASFPRRMFILRGTGGAGGVAWAMEFLRKEVDIKGSASIAQLAHVCSTNDLGLGSAQFGANIVGNEARVRLAMEVSLEPLYVVNPCMALWEMKPFVMLADRFGYTVTVVSPEEICPAWNDVDFLLSRNEERFSRETLEDMIVSFEDLPSSGDPRPAIRAAMRPESDASMEGASCTLAPSAMLYRLEKFMLEGSNLMRYTPPNGRGWGVNGELEGSWHSFRALPDDTCTYEDDGMLWRTEDPENTWTFEGLAWLEDLRIQAFQLDEAHLPTAVSHPGLFLADSKTSEPPAPKTPPARPPPAKRTLPEEKVELAPTAASLPASRRERFKQRVRQQLEQPHAQEQEEEPAPTPPAKRPRNSGPQPPLSAPPKAVFDADTYEPPKGMPTEQEEMSAATFLAAVKARLMDWGKVELYHEFVVALSGSVDAKAAVRILRGHDDLLKVFRNKFAPRSDLLAIKAELDEESDPDRPQAPSEPPPGHGPPSRSFAPRLGAVKQELGQKALQVKQELGRRAVKKELGSKVKSEVKTEDMPRPPSYDPNAPRPVVTVGDDDSDEDVMDDATISAAVKKGRDECISQLAKTVFRKERESREGVRQRFDMVRYATRRAAKPRFPRELFILRGPPGIGKTDYATQQLNDHVDVDPSEALAARLTHVCATDDFYEMFKGDCPEYIFDPQKLGTQQLRNQARVRLAMEAGIHPLFVDEPNMRLWEMRPYLALAERLGYVTTVVEPLEICERWDDLEFLVAANGTLERREAGKVVSREVLSALVDDFESLPTSGDPLENIRTARQGGAQTVLGVAAHGGQTKARGMSGKSASAKKVKSEIRTRQN